MKFSQLKNILNGEILQFNQDHEIQHILTDSRKVINSRNVLFFVRKGPTYDAHSFIKDLYAGGVRNFVVEIKEDFSRYSEANFFYSPSGIPALQELVKFHRSKYQPLVIGITGSNGKTIVKEWLLQLLSTRYRIVATPHSHNSQLGVPLSVWQLNENHDLGIFEAGISLPGEMEKLEKIIQPELGIFTNIGPAHDEGFKSRQEKIREKLKLFVHCKKVIYCKDHKDIDKEITAQGIQTFSWGRNMDAELQITDQTEQLNRTVTKFLYKSEEAEIVLPVTDPASTENLLHCIACMIFLDYSWNEIQERIQMIAPVAMRLELKKGINGCYIVDDSYNNDLAGLKIALDFLKQQRQHQHKTVILSDIFQSGMPSEVLYHQVNELLHQHQVERLIGIGHEISANSDKININFTCFSSTDAFLHNSDAISFEDEMILVKGARAFSFEKIVRRLQEKIHGTRLEINLGALTHNLNYFRSCLKKETKIMVMVKAFAYGSGTHEIANLLQYHKVDYLGVAYTDEGVHLRQNGVEIPVMIMNPSPDGYDQLLKYQLEPEVYGFQQLENLIKMLNGRKIKIHIKLDTGMHRLGFYEEDIPKLIKILQENPDLQVASIFSHLAAADEAEHEDFSRQQAEKFTSLSNKICSTLNIKPLLHILNSPGIIRYPEYQLDMVRLGIGLYGIEPNQVRQNQLLSVSTLKTVISQIRNVDPGQTIGYGRKGKADKKKKIATIAIGYADGFSRFFSNGKGQVTVNGKRASVIGNVCMDMTMIDITDIEAEEGDEVVVFGDDPTINELAERIGTIPYEILTNVSERVTRIYHYD